MDDRLLPRRVTTRFPSFIRREGAHHGRPTRSEGARRGMRVPPAAQGPAPGSRRVRGLLSFPAMAGGKKG